MNEQFYDLINHSVFFTVISWNKVVQNLWQFVKQTNLCQVNKHFLFSLPFPCKVTIQACNITVCITLSPHTRNDDKSWESPKNNKEATYAASSSQFYSINIYGHLRPPWCSSLRSLLLISSEQCQQAILKGHWDEMAKDGCPRCICMPPNASTVCICFSTVSPPQNTFAITAHIQTVFLLPTEKSQGH